MIAGVEMRPLASSLMDGFQVIGLGCVGAIGELKNTLDLARRIVLIVCSSPSCDDD